MLQDQDQQEPITATDQRTWLEQQQDALYARLHQDLINGVTKRKSFDFIQIEMNLVMLLKAVVYFYLQKRIAKRRERLQNNDISAAQPPQNAEFILYLLLDKKQRDEILPNMNEEYEEIADRFGTRRAALWYWKQVLTSLSPFFRSKVSYAFVKVLVKWFPSIREYLSDEWKTRLG